MILFICLEIHLMLRKLVPIVIYIVGAINSHFLTSLSFVLSCDITMTKKCSLLARNYKLLCPEDILPKMLNKYL